MSQHENFDPAIPPLLVAWDAATGNYSMWGTPPLEGILAGVGANVFEYTIWNCEEWYRTDL